MKKFSYLLVSVLLNFSLAGANSQGFVFSPESIVSLEQISKWHPKFVPEIKIYCHGETEFYCASSNCETKLALVGK